MSIQTIRGNVELFVQDQKLGNISALCITDSTGPRRMIQTQMWLASQEGSPYRTNACLVGENHERIVVVDFSEAKKLPKIHFTSSEFTADLVSSLIHALEVLEPVFTHPEFETLSPFNVAENAKALDKRLRKQGACDLAAVVWRFADRAEAGWMASGIGSLVMPWARAWDVRAGMKRAKKDGTLRFEHKPMPRWRRK